MDRGKVVGLFADEYMPTVMKGRDENYLCNATKKALEILSNNAAGSKKGFMVMIEGSQIDSEGHANNAEGILAETRDFERAVGAAMDFADTHPGTLVVVTADHETSGLSITSNKTDFTLSESGIGYQFGTTGHTGTLVPVYLYGVRRPDQRDHGQHRPAERNRSVDAAEIVPADFIRYAERSPPTGESVLCFNRRERCSGGRTKEAAFLWTSISDAGCWRLPIRN